MCLKGIQVYTSFLVNRRIMKGKMSDSLRRRLPVRQKLCGAPQLSVLRLGNSRHGTPQHRDSTLGSIRCYIVFGIPPIHFSGDARWTRTHSQRRGLVSSYAPHGGIVQPRLIMMEKGCKETCIEDRWTCSDEKILLLHLTDYSMETGKT
jgi:hypothetical protein